MMKRCTPQLTAVALAFALAAVAGTANAQASQAAQAPGYVSSAAGQVWTSPYGLCWKTSDWTPARAKAPCDAVQTVSAPAPVVVAAPAPLAVAPAPAAPAPIIEKVSLQSDVLFAFVGFDINVYLMWGHQIAVGHADRIGNEQYNEKLSAERAEAVRQYLAKLGIEENRVRTEGRGDNEPVTGDQCKGVRGTKLIACLQPDRRVEIEVRGTREVAGGAGSPATGGTSGASGGATGTTK
jgi:OOP family OmpA-OmpF porin